MLSSLMVHWQIILVEIALIQNCRYISRVLNKVSENKLVIYGSKTLSSPLMGVKEILLARHQIYF